MNNQRPWRRKKSFNHLLVKWKLHEKGEGEGEKNWRMYIAEEAT